MLDFLLYVVEGLGLFVTATFVFDVIHYTLHRFQQSRFAVLRWLGNLHQAHHDYFDRELRFHEETAGRNLVCHVVPEYSTQMAVTALGLFVLPWPPVAGVMIVFTWIFVAVLFMRGKDKNHVAFEVLPATHEAVRILAPYHWWCRRSGSARIFPAPIAAVATRSCGTATFSCCVTARSSTTPWQPIATHSSP